jgi:carboxypeptidase Q
MRKLTFVVAVLFASLSFLSAAQPSNWLEPYRAPAAKLIAASQGSDFAWQRLAEVTDLYGNRLSGSVGLERAIDWAVAEMKKDGLDNVRKERVMVPKWVRGRESLVLVDPVPQPLVMLGLGNSVGTGPEGITADVLVIKSFEDLDKRSADVKGKIVLFNVPFLRSPGTTAQEIRRNGR